MDDVPSVGEPDWAFARYPEVLERAGEFDLIAVVDGQENASHDDVVRAMWELGKRRSSEAVPALAEKLEFRVFPPGEFRTRDLPQCFSTPLHSYPARPAVYPAVYGLTKIGEPAVPGVLDIVAERGGSTEFFMNAAYVLLYVLGPEGARQRVIRALEALEGEQVERMQRLLRTIPIQGG